MKRENLAIAIAVGAFVFWIAENVYFGWNHTPQTGLEALCDGISLFGLFLSYLVKPSSNTLQYNIHTSGPVNLSHVDSNEIKKAE